MLEALPKAKATLVNRGHHADWFLGALIAKGSAPCIPSKVDRKIPNSDAGFFTASTIASKTSSAN